MPRPSTGQPTPSFFDAHESGRDQAPLAGEVTGPLPPPDFTPPNLGHAMERRHPSWEAYESGDEPATGFRPMRWLLLLAAITLISWWGVRTLVHRNVIDQSDRSFRDVSLLPARDVGQARPEMQLHLYYVVRGQALASQIRRLRAPAGGIERVYLAARELAETQPGNIFESPLPRGTQVRGLYILDGVAWIDLSSEFLKPAVASPLAERLAIYSIVNSLLLNEPTLQGVRFMIEGQPVSSAWGWLDLSTPLGPDLSLVQ